MIGEKIKRIRTIKNLSQEYMADKLGMSVPGYGKIERDETDLPFSRLEQISQVLGMRVEDIVSFDEKIVLNIMNNQIGIKDFNFNQDKLTDNERELFNKLLAAKDSEIESLKKLINNLENRLK